jgi:WD40 repeat protein
VIGAFKPDGSCLAAVAFRRGEEERGTLLKVWEVAGGRELFSVERDIHPYALLAISPDGRWLATTERAPDDPENPPEPGDWLRLWDIATGREIRLLKCGRSLRQLTFSPDGTRLAASSNDTRGSDVIQLWDTRTGENDATLQGHFVAGSNFAFSPDGGRIAAIRNPKDGPSEVQVWNTNSGDPVLRMRTQPNRGELAFSTDGRRLVLRGWHERIGVTKSPVSFTRDGRQEHRGSSGSYTGLMVEIWDATPLPEEKPR